MARCVAPIALAAAFGVSLAPASVCAQAETDIAIRRSLLDEAERARREGDLRRALDRAQRALTIQSSPSVRLFAAELQESLGLFAAALGSAEICLRDANRDGALNNREAILGACSSLNTRVRAHLGRVVVRVQHVAGVRVAMDGESIPDAAFDTPIPASEGRREIVATAPGRPPFRVTVDVSPGATSDVTVDFAASTGGDSGGAASHDRGGGRSFAGPIALAVTAGVGFAGAGIFFALREGALAGCSRMPGEIGCPDSATLSRAQAAPTHNALTNISWGVGGAAAIGSAVWFVVAATQRPASSAARGAGVAVTPVVLSSCADAGSGGSLFVGGVAAGAF